MDSKKLKVLDLFSGIGGFSLGLHRAGFETAAFCEVDEFCQKVLAKNFPGIPIFDDIKTLTKEKLNDQGISTVDILCGGFPCQPFSNAGKKKGRQDDRDLWPEMFRVIKETKPTWVIGENVAGFISMEFTRTKIDLESIGYRVLPFTIPACAVGANHRRDRIWIIAHLDRTKLRIESGGGSRTSGESSRVSGDDGQEEFASDLNSDGRIENISLQAWNEEPGPVSIGACEERLIANTHRQRMEGLGSPIRDGEKHPVSSCESIQESIADIDSNGLGGKTNATKKKNTKRDWENNWWSEAATYFGGWWTDQSRVGRDVYGFSTELDKSRRFRVKALGNSVVPQIPELIGRYIQEVESVQL